MDDCCIKNLENMHYVTDQFWWLQRFVLASPFILLIPDLDPTMGTKEIVEMGLEKASVYTYEQASSSLNKNKTLPDFVDTVKNIGKGSYSELRMMAAGHIGKHSFSMKERKVAGYWGSMAIAYDKAFNGQ
ncbi:MAG: hypothetical protein KIS76_07130 [Pyrinomonadaceae bacterium]|nr:hypothetical protein [Pyrinomonadaceae bacterium]